MIRATGRRRNERRHRGRGSRAGRPAARGQAQRRARVPAVEHALRFAEPVDARRDDPIRDRPAIAGGALDGHTQTLDRAAVVRTSSPSPAPSIPLAPSARAARSRARWLIDLSPGSPGSPRSRAAGSMVGRPGRRGVEVLGRHRPAAQCLLAPPTFSVAPDRTGSPWRSRTWAWIGRSAAIRSANCSSVIYCSPSERASSGRGWTSTMTPSAPDRDAAEGERLDQPALARRVARVDDDRQVGQVVEERHRRQVHRVAGVRLERPDAALAQDHVGVARS